MNTTHIVLKFYSFTTGSGGFNLSYAVYLRGSDYYIGDVYVAQVRRLYSVPPFVATKLKSECLPIRKKNIIRNMILKQYHSRLGNWDSFAQLSNIIFRTWLRNPGMFSVWYAVLLKSGCFGSNLRWSRVSWVGSELYMRSCDFWGRLKSGSRLIHGSIPRYPPYMRPTSVPRYHDRGQ